MNELTQLWCLDKFSKLLDDSFPRMHRFVDGHEEVYMYCFGSLEKNGKKYYLHFEFNKHYPYQFYYGCYCPEPNASTDELQKEWNMFLQPLRRAFAQFWGSRTIAEARLHPYYYDKLFWPFWINIEDAEEINEAVKGIFAIVAALTGIGFKYNPNDYYEKCEVIDII